MVFSRSFSLARLGHVPPRGITQRRRLLQPPGFACAVLSRLIFRREVLLGVIDLLGDVNWVRIGNFWSRAVVLFLNLRMFSLI